mgnify:CR=1 FL=1
MSARIFVTSCGSKACATFGSVCNSSWKAAAGSEAMRLLSSRFDARRAGTAVDRRIFAEHLAGTEIAEAHRSAGHRIDGDADFALDDEEHVVGSIEIADDRISRPAAAPGATLLQALASLGAEPGKGWRCLRETVEAAEAACSLS